CTADGHFVFSVDRTSTKPEIDPGSLVIAGNRSCAPVICTPDFAIFKFPVTSCGTHVFTVAETTIYLAEVHGLVRGNQQMYGQITRDGPYRFQVECRYSKGHLASTGYLVVNPPPPSAALAFGSLGVRLRIATDTSYTSFYPQSHLPLSFLLGSKVYLEVQLVNPPNPNVVLLVHYCIAYPQSSQAAWVILYEGCPNILDYSSAAGLHVKYNNMPVSKHTRRFEIQSFQFLDYKTKLHLDEEIYFMCSTEVCSPEHRVCNEGCFDGRDKSNTLVTVKDDTRKCGYSLVHGRGKNIFTTPYTACDVKMLNNFYILRVLYTTLTGERGDIQAKCPVPGLVPREACTADGHFVFSVDRTSTKPEIDPGSLVIAGNRSCAPVICTPDFAIFKFPVTGCGTHVFTVAETTIYLAEVHGLVRGNQQMYGQITRDGPYRFQVECRYSKGHLASTGYLVVNPPPPSAALAFGSLGVRLRIATDTSYTSFYPQSHLPLSFLLGSKVYLEVQLVNPPNPNVVLLVHYCIAYPQSSQAAWVILYEGCPNILDYSSAAGLHVKYNNMPVSKHTRRFEIQSFQFLDYKTKLHLDEEIYFMCSTEVCSPEHRVCNEGCFDGRGMLLKSTLDPPFLRMLILFVVWLFLGPA
ncbi:UNVERIFIED_CONTAM: hypothetical protein FKN15_076045, partial [Acipenser sinensis]